MIIENPVKLKLYMTWFQFLILKPFVKSLFKLNESAGTKGHPFKLHKKTVFTNEYALCVCVCVCVTVCRRVCGTNGIINSWNNLSNIIKY